MSTQPFLRRSTGFLFSLITLCWLGGGLSLHAHPGHDIAQGFAPGLSHPFSGLDHILAMVAIGLWAAQMGGRARWMVPATFVGTMACGGLLGMAGVQLPFVEQGILASVFLLGLFITLAFRPSLAFTVPLVGAFAICHGFAHGAEAPQNGSGLIYAIGFLLATALLHATGIALGMGIQKVAGQRLIRLGGLAVIAIGFLLFSTPATEAAPLSQPLKSVIDPYLSITSALASDSFKGVPENAAALNKAVQANAKNLPPALGQEAATLAQAKDIAAARTALKPLSASLVSALAAQKADSGTLYEAVCPMSGVWLQSDKKVRNPYDASMSECGDIKRSF